MRASPVEVTEPVVVLVPGGYGTTLAFVSVKLLVGVAEVLTPHQSTDQPVP